MRLQFLGTAAAEAYPALFCHCTFCLEARRLAGRNLRCRSGAVINDGALYIDFPPDIYMKARDLQLDLGSMTNLIVTHSHRDHFATNELMMRDSSYFAHYPEGEKPLNIFGNAQVLAALAKAVNEHFGVAERPSFAPHEIAPFSPFFVGKLRITPLPALHDRREMCFIYMVEESNCRLLYAHDSGYFSEEVWNYIAGIPFDLVSLDCCFGPMKDGANHMGIPDNIEVKERLWQINCATTDTQFIINHFSHNCGLQHEELTVAAAPHGFIVAYDGMVIDK